jgi:uncharacterized protein YdgA (DUF945 family)
MNKKYTLMAIAVAALAYPGIAWLMGFAIQSRVALSAEELQAQSPYLTLVKQQFQRGWFSSVQVVTFGIVSGPWRQEITVRNLIHHGPICGLTCVGLAQIDTHVLWSGEVQTILTKWYGATEPLTVSSRLGLFGGGKTTISNPALKQSALDGGGDIAWDGARVTIEFTNNNDRLDLQGSAPRLVYTGADGSRVEVRAVSLNSTSKRVLPMLYASDVDTAIDRVDITGPNGINSTTINKLTYAVNTSSDAGYLDMGVKFDTGAITSTIVKLQAAHFDFTMMHLQMQALETINKKVRELNRQAGAPATDPGKLLAGLREPIAALMLEHPEIRLDRVGVDTNSGQIRLSGAVRMSGAASADFAEGANPKDLLAKVEGDFDFSMDDAALAELPGAGSRPDAQLQALAQQGFMDHSNGRWKSKIRYAHAQVTLNGKPFPPQGAGAAH